jgi:hypothetical protein
MIPLIPLLLVLVIPSLILPAAFLFLLQKTVRPVLVATAVSIPFSLFICGWWAIGASFDTSSLDGIEVADKWWGTTGLRICAVILWALAAWFGRLVWLRRRRLERTVAVVEVCQTNLGSIRTLTGSSPRSFYSRIHLYSYFHHSYWLSLHSRPYRSSPWWSGLV